jgi:hypothetical protein
MNWVLVGLAVVAFAAAGGLWWWRSRVGREIELMAATPTTQAAQVANLAPGTVVEVKGVLRCAAPLTGEFSKKPCVYCKSEISREVVYFERNSQGQRERKSRTEPVQSNTRFTSCSVEDDSGQVILNLDGAEVEGREVVRRRESEDQSLGALVVSVVSSGSNETRTLIYTESILDSGVPV